MRGFLRDAGCDFSSSVPPLLDCSSDDCIPRFGKGLGKNRFIFTAVVGCEAAVGCVGSQLLFARELPMAAEAAGQSSQSQVDLSWKAFEACEVSCCISAATDPRGDVLRCTPFRSEAASVALASSSSSEIALSTKSRRCGPM